jgi:hypothetical protein
VPCSILRHRLSGLSYGTARRLRFMFVIAFPNSMRAVYELYITRAAILCHASRTSCIQGITSLVPGPSATTVLKKSRAVQPWS